MLVGTDESGVLVQPNTLTSITTWTSDGTSDFLGFMGTGDYSGMFYLKVQKPEEDELLYYIYQTSPSNRTAYVVDRIERFVADTVITLYVKHDAADAQLFYGTLLGGSNWEA